MFLGGIAMCLKQPFVFPKGTPLHPIQVWFSDHEVLRRANSNEELHFQCHLEFTASLALVNLSFFISWSLSSQIKQDLHHTPLSFSIGVSWSQAYRNKPENVQSKSKRQEPNEKAQRSLLLYKTLRSRIWAFSGSLAQAGRDKGNYMP